MFFLSFRGSSGLEVKLSHKPLSEVDIENPSSETVDLHGGSGSPSDASDGEQDFVSSVVSGEPPKARVHWGQLPKRHGGDEEEQLGKDRGSAKDERKLRSERENHSEALKTSPTSSEPTDSQSPPDLEDKNTPVEETRKSLDQFSLSDNSSPVITPEDTSAANVQPENCDAKADTKDDTSLNISHVGMSKKSAAGLKSLLKNHIKAKTEAPSVKLNLLESLRVTLMEWRTVETMRFLYGPDYAKKTEPMPQNEEEEEEELDEDDLEDTEEVSKKAKCSSGRRARPAAAAPDYETLRKETELLNLRVQEFYTGVCVLPEEDVTRDRGDTEVRFYIQ